MKHEDVTFLFRRLLESFTDYHADLKLAFRAMPGRVDWLLTGNINDQGKLVGRQAAHIKAIKFLLAEIGSKQDEDFRLRLVDAEGVRLEPNPPRIAPPDFDTMPARDLLYDLLVALLDEPPMIGVIPDSMQGHSPGFTFRIHCTRIQDYESLVTPVEGDPTNQTILTALGTLFRAAGFKDGVAFKIEVPGRT